MFSNLPRTAIVGAVVLVTAIIGWLAISEFVFDSAPAPSAPATSTSAVPEAQPFVQQQVIGTSVEGRAIAAYQFGNGPDTLLFVGGIHGGYEWNSSLLAWEMIDYLEANPSEVPPQVTVHIIPSLNPDGLALVVGTGGRFTQSDVLNPSTRVAEARFNANDVDLNRNFDCNWAPESTWRGATVSAGAAPFSEPEAAALRDYVYATEPVAVAFWHSQANNVYGSACNRGVLPATTELGEAYADAANYGYIDLFDAYPITGDAEGWLASIGIPAVTIEKESYQSSEWERNWAGMQSWFEYATAQNLLIAI